MMISRNLILGLIITWFVPLFVNAQDTGDSYPNYYWTQEQHTPEEGNAINCGYVVAFGVLLPRPYHVAFRDDTVWINYVAYQPTQPDPNPPQYPEPGDTITQIASILVDIENKYPSSKVQYGEKRAQEMILQEYKDHALISTITFTEDGKELWVEFVTGFRANVLRKTSKITNPRRPPATKQELTLQRQKKVGYLQRVLRKDKMILFGYNCPKKIISSREWIQLFHIVEKTKKGDFSADEGRDKIIELLYWSKFADDIMQNLNTWSISD
jgi:hypothetical protein